MENPYESPQESAAQSGELLPVQVSPGNGMAGQVRIICILMWVQGGLELMMGIFLIGMGVFMGFFMQAVIENDLNFSNNGGNPPPENMGWLMGGFYIAMAIPVLLAAFLHIYAGFQNFSFRSRTFGIVALLLGLCSSLSCYCLPVALAIYGLIVYLNPEVKAAFAMREQGHTADEILATFARYRM